MTDLEPRVSMLERLHHDNSLTLQAVQSDLHHMTRTFDKMEKTLSRITDTLSEVQIVRDSVSRSHARIDSLEVRVSNANDEFLKCKSSKLDKDDIKNLTAKVDGIIVESASRAWVERAAWIVFAAIVAIVFSGN